MDLVRNAIEIAYKAIDYKKTLAYSELYDSICDKNCRLFFQLYIVKLLKILKQ